MLRKVGWGTSLVECLSRAPRLGRWAVRAYLRCARPSSLDRHWVLEALKTRLTTEPRIVDVAIGDGLVVEVDWSTSIGRELYFHRSYEPEMVSLLDRLLKPGMVMIDAGANIGELTVRAARRVGPAGRVLAVEASPAVHARLARNVERNGFSDRVTLVAAAVSDADGEVEFYVSPGVDSLSSSLYRPSEGGGHTTRVVARRLDAIARQHGLQRVDVLKLDVEGAEFAALDGARELLASPAAPAVIFEYNPDVMRHAGGSIDQLMRLLADYGYRFAVIGRNGTTTPCTLETIEQALPKQGLAKSDILATRENRGEGT